jgi:hypothetical protein
MEMRMSFTVSDEAAAALLPNMIRDILDARPDAWRLVHPVLMKPSNLILAGNCPRMLFCFGRRRSRDN